MIKCPNCKNEVTDEAAFCPVCGNALNTIPGYDPDFHPEVKPNPAPVYPVYTPVQPVPDPFDHTGEFEQEDIRENKLVSMLVYLLDFVGIIIALLMGTHSDYTHFHIRQSMKFTVVEILLTLASLVLCWTIFVPIAGAIILFALMVIKFISFIQVCSGKAMEPFVIRSIGFLK